MLRSCVGLGLALQGVISGMWSYSESQGVIWLPFVLGFVALAPTVTRWASAFAYSELDGELLWCPNQQLSFEGVDETSY
jgi:hypothetical protein